MISADEFAGLAYKRARKNIIGSEDDEDEWDVIENSDSANEKKAKRSLLGIS